MKRKQISSFIFTACLAFFITSPALAALPSDRKIEMDVQDAVEARMHQSDGLVALQGVRLLSRENVTEDRVNATVQISLIRTERKILITEQHGRIWPQDLRIINALPPGTRWNETAEVFMRPVFGQWAIVDSKTIRRGDAGFERALAKAKSDVAEDDAMAARAQAAEIAKARAIYEAKTRAEAATLARRDATLIAEAGPVVQEFVDSTRNGEFAKAMQLTVDGSSAYYQGRGDFRAGIGHAPTVPKITGVARYFREGDTERLVLATEQHGELTLRRKAPDGWKLVGAVNQAKR